MTRFDPTIVQGAQDLGPARISDVPGMPRYHRWQGRSGRRYLAAVYEGCPAELPDDSVVMVVGVEGGVRRLRGVMAFGAADAGAAERLRKAVQLLGAGEVHVHLLARTATARAAVVRDLLPPPRLIACSAA